MERREVALGVKCGRLTITKIEAGRVEAICECGNIWRGERYRLYSGMTSSCGCLHREVVGSLNLGHGHTKGGRPTKVYRAWLSMKRRCYEDIPKHHHYKRKGIQVCERWLNGEGPLTGFECFLKDVGYPPSKDHSIDRIDNDGHYTPKNVRWATIEQQANNRDNNHPIEARGKKQNISEWSKEMEIKYHLLEYRLRRGWNPVKALTTPPRPLKR